MIVTEVSVVAEPAENSPFLLEEELRAENEALRAALAETQADFCSYKKEAQAELAEAQAEIKRHGLRKRPKRQRFG